MGKRNDYIGRGNMNIFLDTNVFYNDPFLAKGMKKILLLLASHKDVKLFISKTVYAELFRQHSNFLEKEVKSVKEAFMKLSPFVKEKREKFTFDINLDNLKRDFHDTFEIFQTNEQIEIINYDSDVLEKIVEIDMYKKPPFIKLEETTNKNGDKVPYYKKEIRDAIIWYSYQEFIKKSNLKDCYFISNNTTDFGKKVTKKGSKDEPYPLHPDLNENGNMTAFRTVQSFFAHMDKQIKEFFKDKDLHTRILSEGLLENIMDELSGGMAEELIDKFFTEEILSETNRILSEYQPNEIHQDYFMDGYVDPSMDGIIRDIRFNEVNVYGDSITVTVEVDVDMEVDIYLYNPVYDNRDEKFENYSTDTMKVTELIVFILPVDPDKVLDINNFSLKAYIEGNEPDYLNIEIIYTENIDHTDMFRDEEYEE